MGYEITRWENQEHMYSFICHFFHNVRDLILTTNKIK